jgi:hypothetical protein
LDCPAAQLVFGALSLRETYASVQSSSFYELNRNLVIGAVLISTIFLHELQFHLFGVLLPKDRTALFLAPLGLFVSLAARFCCPASSRAGSVLRI